jgi:hypothetical protein
MALDIGKENVVAIGELPPKPKRTFTVGRRAANKYTELASLLKGTPGQWFAIGTAEKNHQGQALAFRIRKGKSAAFRPEGEFEARSIADDATGVNTVYARFNGSPESTAEVAAIEEAVAASQVPEVEVSEEDDDNWGDE